MRQTTKTTQKGFLWWLPAPPKSPDYSTPEAVTMRAFEKGLHPSWTVPMYRLLRADGKVYRDFMTAIRATAGR